MKKKLAALVAVVLMLAFLVSAAMADEVSAPVTIKAAGSDELKEEYAAANVVLDVYCLALLDNGTFKLTDDYSKLDLSENEGETAEERADRIAQDAAKITFADGAEIEHTQQELDKLQEDMLLGLYLIVPHGSDLEASEYVKIIKDKYVTIAQIDDYEYRFSPTLLTLDYENPDVEIEIKGEKKYRYGTVRIVKTLESYETSSPVTFGFNIHAEKDGAAVFDDVAGLTFNGVGSNYVDVERIPAGAVVTVSEVYSGSAYAQISPDPQSVTVKAGETVTILIGGEDSGNTDSFKNDYTDEEQKGHGVINKFEADEDGGWLWYKNGVLQTQE